MQWFVNDQLVREEADTVPDQDTPLRLNFRSPDSFFVEAFDVALQPAANLAENQTFVYEVDFVRITTGPSHAVPEPSSTLLWISGFATLALLVRRRGTPQWWGRQT